MVDEQPKIKLRFADEQESPTLEIRNGEYLRTFDAKDQPFEMKDEEEAQLLRNTGHFVDAESKEQNVTGEDLAATNSKATKTQGKIGGTPAGPDVLP